MTTQHTRSIAFIIALTLSNRAFADGAASTTARSVLSTPEKADPEGSDATPARFTVSMVASETRKPALEHEAPRPKAERADDDMPIWVLTAAGVAVVAIGAGVAIMGTTRRAQGDDFLDEIESDGTVCDPAAPSKHCQPGFDAIAQAEPYETAGLVLASTGAALVVSGIVYALITDSKPNDGVAIVPVVGPEVAGIAAQVAF
ncbi:MAG: hypothetical protein HOW73_27085 [Polyangiaceae bacterium]|nr:hypothetical protein [Polyangiaceae bacterium]